MSVYEYKDSRFKPGMRVLVGGSHKGTIRVVLAEQLYVELDEKIEGLQNPYFFFNKECKRIN